MDGLEDCTPYIQSMYSQPQDVIKFFKELALGGIVLNIIFTLTASLGNGMIILAILSSQNLQTPSYLLITSLAFTDLLMGLVFHPLFGIANIFVIDKNIHPLCITVEAFNFTLPFLGTLSLMMVTCISIDRYMALRLRHRYNIIVTKKRVRLLIVAVWVLAIVFASNTRIFPHSYVFTFIFVSILAIVLLAVTSVCYFKSFRELHLYTVQVHAQQQNQLAGNFDVVRYKKTLKTMLVILACILLCFVPIICSMAAVSALGFRKETIVSHEISLLFLALSSSINPVIYLIRFTDIRIACRQMLEKLKLRC